MADPLRRPEGYLVYDVNRGVYWTGEGWSKNRNDAELFAYRMFAELAARGFNDGIGMRVERHRRTDADHRSG